MQYTTAVHEMDAVHLLTTIINSTQNGNVKREMANNAEEIPRNCYKR